MFRKVVSSAGARRHIFNTAVRTYKHSMGTFAVAGSLTITATLYGLDNKSACEPLVQPLPTIPLPVIDLTYLTAVQDVQEESLFSLLMRTTTKATSDLAKSAVKSVRYAQRLLLYALYGLPLTGLLPASYVLGSSVPALEEFTWDYIIWSIQRLGPTFVKMAQWASTRPDLFPPSLVNRMIKLQDDVDVNHSRDTIDKTLAAAFGVDWKEKLELDPKPLGAGSVAQVFKGRLKREMKSAVDSGVDMLGRKNAKVAEMFPAGREVAIKMIHPHVESLVRTDMELLDIFAWAIDHIPSLEILSLGETCRQFAEVMNKQLDLRVEANNLVIFSQKFAKDTWAAFPAPIEGLVSKTVLVETLFEGTPINHFMNLQGGVGDSVEKLKLKLSDLGCRLILKMVFFDNFVHGDLHPGEFTRWLLDCTAI
jgi:aarF domain-containing kinase